MCSKFLTSSVDSIPSFHSNYFDSIDEEKSASAKVDALLSATFELEEKVVSTKQRNWKEISKAFGKIHKN